MKKIRLFYLTLIFPVILFAQSREITGTVHDELDEPLPDASVVIKGSTKGVSTDFDGNFAISVGENDKKLVVSYVGYKDFILELTSSNSYKITLEPEDNTLDEVVVIGYGSVKKKDLTGAVTSIKPTDQMAEQTKSIEGLIVGRAAGVQVSANGFEPGATVSIKIRGTSSLTGNTEPLYVVDGIIMDSATEDVDNPISGYSSPQGGGISGVNPADIESIEILKDASATAIYGSRAANGVIIITTKKGKAGKAKFNFTTSSSIGSVVRSIDVLDTETYAHYQNDVQEALGFEDKYVFNPDGTISSKDEDGNLETITGIDWAEDTYRTSIVTKSRITISGGGDDGNYYMAGGLLDNQGTFPNAYARSADFNLNLNQNLSDKIKIRTKIATTYTELSATKGTDAFGSTNHSMVKQVILAAPILNFSDNNLDEDDIDENIDGPRAWTTDYDDDSKDVRLLGSITMDYKFNSAFTYRLRFGGDYRAKERSFWYGNALLKGRNSNSIAGLSTLNRFRYNIDNTLMYKKKFKNSRIDATVGALIDKTSIKKTSYTASDFADKSLRADGISFGATHTPLYINSEYPTIVSFIGRLNYILLDKYYFTGTFRADGSSKFNEGNRWGYFPAFSFAWKISEESFLVDSNTVSNLKLRMGYGEVGNQNINSYSFLTPFSATGSALSDASGGSLIAVVPSNLANPDLIWEKSVQYNGGLDFGLFRGRLNGVVDVYYKTSSDLLLRAPIGPSAGFNYIIANQGNIENKGLEISLDADIIQNDKFRWNVFGNVSFNKNKIGGLGEIIPVEFGSLGKIRAYLGTEIAGGTFFKQPANIFIEGEEAGLFFGLETDGIIRSDQQLISPDTGEPITYKGQEMRVGDVYFVDQNGDGDINDKDKTIIGNPNPEFSYGFGTSFEYKAFSLNVLFSGVQGNDIANGNLFETGYANGTTKNVSTIAYKDAFDPINNPNGSYPMVAADKLGNDYTREFNDRIIEDGSFLRLSYVTLGYVIPVDRINFIDNAKVFMSGQNLWLLTDYTGFDPEVNSFSFDATRVGVDWGSFPNQRTFILGLNITF